MSTHYKGTAREKLALDTFIKLIRSGDSLSSGIKLILAKNSLTESQFNVLDALFHLGHLTQKELGKKLLKSGGNITMVIDNLEKLELVKRKRGEKDRRTFAVHLTVEGRNKIKFVLPGIVKFINEEMNILTPKEQHELQKMCKAIGLKKK
jgi:MarR family 2-MHQ and catechol resistance regulon transcriptional repressor